MRKFNKDEIKEKIKNHHLYRRALESKRFLLLLIILITLISYNYFSHGFVYNLANSNIENIVNFIGSFGNLSWLVYILIIIIEVLLAPIPGILMGAAGGVIFNPFLGAIFNLIGNIIGASIAYFLAKRYGGFYFEKLIGEKKLASFNRYNNRYGALVLFVLRLNPVTSSDIFNYLSGIIEIPYKKFILSTILGLMPTIFITSYFGEIFIKESPFLRLFFILITLIYVLIFLYGYYKIGEEKFNNRIRNFRK